MEPTYSVSALGREIKELLAEAFDSVWVAGEIQRYKASPAGHHYFDLVEKGEGDKIVGVLSAVVWKGEYLRLRAALDRAGARLVDGQRVRCRVSVDFYPPGGRLQVQVREIDPNFTLGDLARRREETIAALAESGLLELNKALPLPPIVLDIGLVTSGGSAAYHDFLATLAESGYGFRILFVHSAVQGPEAEVSLPSALRFAAAAGCDLVALIRGGGSKSDLAVFDSRAVAEAVARSPLPVWTGLGHEIDESVADLAAHRSFKTPTKVAEELVARIANADLAIARLREQMTRQARLSVAEAGGRLARAERRAVAARTRLAQVGLRLATLAEGLRRVARHRLRAAEQQIAGWSRLVAELAPSRTLRRGFSITRDAAGTVLRDPAAVAAGTTIESELAGGRLTSRVEERR
ncbi:MAG: exodeoxyribonuclease VII large subunit [Thermoanaerobaculia bacterium]